MADLHENEPLAPGFEFLSDDNAAKTRQLIARHRLYGAFEGDPTKSGYIFMPMSVRGDGPVEIAYRRHVNRNQYGERSIFIFGWKPKIQFEADQIDELARILNGQLYTVGDALAHLGERTMRLKPNERSLLSRQALRELNALHDNPDKLNDLSLDPKNWRGFPSLSAVFVRGPWQWES